MVAKARVAFITFKNKRSAEKVAAACAKGVFDYVWWPSHLKMNEAKLSIALAPAPSEVIWENLSTHFSWKRSIAIWGSTLAVLIVSGLINFGIARLEGGHFALGLLAAVLLLLVNKALKITLWALSLGEKHHSRSQFEVAHMARLLLATFVNTGLIPFFSNLSPASYFASGGLVDDITNIFLVVGFVDPFLSFIDLRFLLSWLHQKYLRNQADQCGYTQLRANAVFAGVSPSMAEKYSDFFLAYLLAMFYLPLFPLGALLAVLGFWLEHFV